MRQSNALSSRSNWQASSATGTLLCLARRSGSLLGCILRSDMPAAGHVPTHAFARAQVHIDMHLLPAVFYSVCMHHASCMHHANRIESCCPTQLPPHATSLLPCVPYTIKPVSPLLCRSLGGADLLSLMAAMERQSATNRDKNAVAGSSSRPNRGLRNVESGCGGGKRRLLLPSLRKRRNTCSE